MKHARKNLIETTFRHLSSDNLLEILLKIEYEYPWQTIQFIFKESKTINKKWLFVIKTNTKCLYENIGSTSLHFASAMDYADEIVRLNLEENYSLRMPDQQGYSPAYYAVGTGSYHAMRRLKMGYALNTKLTTKEDLLRITSKGSDSTITDLLEDYKDDLTSDDLTEAHKIFRDVVTNESLSKLEDFLIRDTISKNCFIKSTRFQYYMKLEKHQLLKNTKINKFLIYAFKNWLVNKFWKMVRNRELDKEIAELCITYEINFNTCDEGGNTFLHMSTFPPNHIFDPKISPVLNFLLQRKNIDLDSRNIHSKTPLEVAIMVGNAEALKILLGKKKSCCPNRLDNLFDLALIRDRTECLDVLMDYEYEFIETSTGPSAKIIDYNLLYRNLLHRAIGFGSTDCVQFLTNESTVNSINHKGFAPLFYAIIHNSARRSMSLQQARNPHLDFMNHLIECGACLESVDKCGNSALHYAIICNFIEGVFYLIKAGANLNARVVRGVSFKNDIYTLFRHYTPLHSAVHLKNIEIVKVLLENRADQTLTTPLGKTPIDFAREGGCKEIISLFSQ
jgi:ankyrin repeat protein